MIHADIAEAPKCWTRKCKHLFIPDPLGVDFVEDRFYCKAFPDGIPDEIAFGDNPHTKPYPGDHGIRYELK